MSLDSDALYKDTDFTKNKTRQQLSTKICFFKILENKNFKTYPSWVRNILLKINGVEIHSPFWKVTFILVITVNILSMAVFDRI